MVWNIFYEFITLNVMMIANSNSFFSQNICHKNGDTININGIINKNTTSRIFCNTVTLCMCDLTESLWCDLPSWKTMF